MRKKHLVCFAIGAAAIVAGGCANDIDQIPGPDPAPPSAVVREATAFVPNAEAGIGRGFSGDPATYWAQLTSNRIFSRRSDPFALHPNERSFEQAQTMERLFDQTGGFTVSFTPQVERVVVPVVEPQPYRRLAGVIVGESVTALIDMGDGRLQIIQPGQLINGWRVISIDSDKAVLRRGGNVLPREVIVRLESPPIGGGSGQGAGGGAGSGGGRSQTAPGGLGPSGGPIAPGDDR